MRALRLLLLLLALSVPLASSAPAAARLELDVGSVEHPLFSARELRLRMDTQAGSPAELSIGRLRVGQRDIGRVRFACPRLRLEGVRVSCAQGRLGIGARTLPAGFQYDGSELQLRIEPQPGERWSIRAGQAGVELSIEQGRLEGLAEWLTGLRAWKPAGLANGHVRFDAAGRARGRLIVSGAAFGNAEGTRAGEKLGARLDFEAARSAGRWQWSASLDWLAGELYWQPWYLAHRPLALRARGEATDTEIEVAQASAALQDVGTVSGAGRWDLTSGALQSLSVSSERLDLGEASQLFVAPVLAERSLPSLSLNGTVSGWAELGRDGLRAFSLDLDRVSAVEGRGRGQLDGVGGRIGGRDDAATRGELRVGAARLGKLPLGGFVLPVEMRGLALRVPRLEIPVLESRLVLEGVSARRTAEGSWNWQLAGALHPVSMERLTEALGLPRMSGTLSASIPRIRQRGSTIGLDGSLVIQVFDGYVSATGLTLSDPLGRVPRLTGDLAVRHVDLGQLTETFSFGSITGFLDGDVNGLELSAWRPTRFDARFSSSPGRYPRRISQRAVQNISALGGAGAVAALQGTFLRFFETFGYERLGIVCRLRQGVCEMDGVEPAPQGYYLVKGGGIPAVNVIGYNRRVDWTELVDRLRRVTASNVKPIIE